MNFQRAIRDFFDDRYTKRIKTDRTPLRADEGQISPFLTKNSSNSEDFRKIFKQKL